MLTKQAITFSDGWRHQYFETFGGMKNLKEFFKTAQFLFLI
jgi:hypothetical protein